MAQLIGTLVGSVIALGGAGVVYGVLHYVTGLRLSQEDEFIGADLAIHKISAINDDVN